MHKIRAYLKGVYIEQPKTHKQGVTFFWGKKHAPDGKILNQVWMGGCPAILILDRGNVFNANGATADQKYPRCRNEWGDLQHTADSAAKNPKPVYKPGTAASAEFP